MIYMSIWLFLDSRNDIERSIRQMANSSDCRVSISSLHNSCISEWPTLIEMGSQYCTNTGVNYSLAALMC